MDEEASGDAKRGLRETSVSRRNTPDLYYHGTSAPSVSRAPSLSRAPSPSTEVVLTSHSQSLIASAAQSEATSLVHSPLDDEKARHMERATRRHVATSSASREAPPSDDRINVMRMMDSFAAADDAEEEAAQLAAKLHPTVHDALGGVLDCVAGTGLSPMLSGLSPMLCPAAAAGLLNDLPDFSLSPLGGGSRS